MGTALHRRTDARYDPIAALYTGCQKPGKHLHHGGDIVIGQHRERRDHEGNGCLVEGENQRICCSWPSGWTLWTAAQTLVPVDAILVQVDAMSPFTCVLCLDGISGIRLGPSSSLSDNVLETGLRGDLLSHLRFRPRWSFFSEGNQRSGCRGHSKNPCSPEEPAATLALGKFCRAVHGLTACVKSCTRGWGRRSTRHASRFELSESVHVSVAGPTSMGVKT